MDSRHPPDRLYSDFSLQVEALRGYRYRVQVVGSLAGDARVEVSLRWTPEELEALWRELENAVRGAGESASHTIRRFGARLFREVFVGEVKGAFDSALKQAAASGRRLRLRLRLKRAPQLAGLPWEYLYDEARGQFLSLMPEISIVRQPEVPRDDLPLGAEPPIRVLVWIANPEGSCPLDSRREWESMVQALSSLVAEGTVSLERIENGTIDALRAALRLGPVHVLHFVGHGAIEAGSNSGYLLLETADGKGDPVRGEKLGTLLTQQPELRLVVLNACQGGGTVRPGTRSAASRRAWCRWESRPWSPCSFPSRTKRRSPSRRSSTRPWRAERRSIRPWPRPG